MNEKYKLGESRDFNGVTLYRVIALRDIGYDVKAGDMGGWIEGEKNLSSSDGDAWVYGDACVSDDACVYGYARVSGNARVFDDACVYGDALVSGNARVFDDACVYGNARVTKETKMEPDEDHRSVNPQAKELLEMSLCSKRQCGKTADILRVLDLAEYALINSLSCVPKHTNDEMYKEIRKLSENAISEIKKLKGE